MNNWFALSVGILEICAGTLSAINGRYYWCGVWIFYGLASVFLFLAEGKT